MGSAPAGLKDSAFAAFIALILAIPLVGFDTNQGNVGTVLGTRFSWVAMPSLVVFFGRLLLGLLPEASAAASGRRW